ncbi:MAG: hypothetical protein ABI432_19765 [Flavobacteriales bacterium]
MNPNRSLLVLTAVVCLSFAVNAQTTSADDYFNRAGTQYVKEDKRAALRTLDQGLQEYPGDPRLLKLAEALLKEEQQKQQQQQKQQEQQQQKDQQQQQEQQKKQEQQQREQEEKQQQEQQAKEGEQDPKNMEPQPGRIAPQDARRILDALERSEKDVQQKVRERQRPARRVTIDKDW